MLVKAVTVRSINVTLVSDTNPELAQSVLIDMYRRQGMGGDG